jgi:demethylmenaquinone methyltransferase/2-methoxy-6-polyprenyl-1,4-benzoquinol methylase
VALEPLPSAQAKPEVVRAMFDRIASRYDRLNRLLTARLDQRWRAAALDAIAIGPRDCVVDLACGTGDLAELALARGARVVGADFARNMLRGAVGRRIRADFVQADATRLPLPDGWASAVVCGFALRNFASLKAVFPEIARVLARGGRVALLEVDRPSNPLLRAGHRFYFDRVVPVVGGLLSDRAAYAYLPRSTVYLPPRSELLALLAAAGFERIAHRSLSLGAIQLAIATRGSRA